MDSASLDEHLAFDPSADLDAMVRAAPARWAVYLFSDADDRPIQLLCVKNLRASLKRRLGASLVEVDEAQPDLPTKRIDYRQIVREISWRRVDSSFEADLVYLDAARRAFPQTYGRMAGLRPAWFVHVDPEVPFPRFVKTTDLSLRGGELFGPLPDKQSAAQLIEHLEDWFDLCRYYDILTKSPDGRACAYKEMGRCPAPCDGSIPMEQYRDLIRYSMSVLFDAPDFIRQQQQRMESAAAELKFEKAGRIKQYVESLSAVLGKGDFRHVRPLREFRFLSLQHGPTAKSAKVFLITRGRVEHIATLVGEPTSASTVLRDALTRAESPPPAPELGQEAIELAGVVAHHLFSAKQRGVFVSLEKLDDRSLLKAYRDSQKQKLSDSAEPAEDDEGVQKELLGT